MRRISDTAEPMLFKPKFLKIVEAAFAPLAARHGMQVARIDNKRLLVGVIYSNGNRAVSFDLDRKDYYLDCRYGPASSLTNSGQIKWPDVDSFGVVNVLLREEGILVPQGLEKLHGRRNLTEAVQLLVDGIERHESLIFDKSVAK